MKYACMMTMLFMNVFVWNGYRQILMLYSYDSLFSTKIVRNNYFDVIIYEEKKNNACQMTCSTDDSVNKWLTVELKLAHISIEKKTIGECMITEKKKIIH